MWEFDDEFKLPKYKVPAFPVIKPPKGRDGTPAEGAILRIAVRAAAHVSEVAGSSWKDCCGRSPPEVESFFCKYLFNALFLVFIYSWVPKCKRPYATWSAIKIVVRYWMSCRFESLIFF